MRVHTLVLSFLLFTLAYGATYKVTYTYSSGQHCESNLSHSVVLMTDGRCAREPDSMVSNSGRITVFNSTTLLSCDYSDDYCTQGEQCRYYSNGDCTTYGFNSDKYTWSFVPVEEGFNGVVKINYKNSTGNECADGHYITIYADGECHFEPDSPVSNSGRITVFNSTTLRSCDYSDNFCSQDEYCLYYTNNVCKGYGSDSDIYSWTLPDPVKPIFELRYTNSSGQDCQNGEPIIIHTTGECQREPESLVSNSGRIFVFNSSVLISCDYSDNDCSEGEYCQFYYNGQCTNYGINSDKYEWTYVPVTSGGGNTNNNGGNTNNNGGNTNNNGGNTNNNGGNTNNNGGNTNNNGGNTNNNGGNTNNGGNGGNTNNNGGNTNNNGGNTNNGGNGGNTNNNGGNTNNNGGNTNNGGNGGNTNNNGGNTNNNGGNTNNNGGNTNNNGGNTNNGGNGGDNGGNNGGDGNGVVPPTVIPHPGLYFAVTYTNSSGHGCIGGEPVIVYANGECQLEIQSQVSNSGRIIVYNSTTLLSCDYSDNECKQGQYCRFYNDGECVNYGINSDMYAWDFVPVTPPTKTPTTPSAGTTASPASTTRSSLSTTTAGGDNQGDGTANSSSKVIVSVGCVLALMGLFI